MDTEATSSILNLDIILKDQWFSHFWNFGTIFKGGFLTTKLIMRQPIIVKFFPEMLYKTKILGSNIPRNDLIIILVHKISIR